MGICCYAFDQHCALNLLSIHVTFIQWHTPCRTLRSASANLLSVTRCNISFGARGFRSAAPTIWNSIPSHVRSCETLTTFRRHLKSHFFLSAFFTHCLVTHLSASDLFSTMALYKLIYLLTYLLLLLLWHMLFYRIDCPIQTVPTILSQLLHMTLLDRSLKPHSLTWYSTMQTEPLQ